MTTCEWTAHLAVHRDDPAAMDRLERALLPEASREVPRARARMSRVDPRTLVLEITAHDTGALRAALNTYLGWVALADATERVAAVRPSSG
jgi:tRNA threonylcarbamoyladenosine modification (KEOPS) complex  Pcc1 subunit